MDSPPAPPIGAASRAVAGPPDDWAGPLPEAVVPIASIPKDGLIVPAVRRAYLVAWLWIGLPTEILAVFAFLALSGHGNPSWVPWLALVLTAGSGPFLMYLMVSAALNAGVAVGDHGILCYCRVLRPSRALRRFVPWSELKTPILGRSTVAFDVSPLAIGVSFEQARAILTHPQYQWRSSIPEETLRRIGIEEGH